MGGLAAWAGLALAAGLTAATPVAAANAGGSRIVRAAIRQTTPAETAGYVRIIGAVEGVVAAGEGVVGLAGLPKNAAGQYAYAADFELIVPAPGRPADEVVYVEAENRGTPLGWRLMGPGFLPSRATSYARVQWQTGYARGVPEGAQGVGLVVVRDFARWLAGRTPGVAVSGGAAPAPYGRLILGGVSQAAWFVNVLVAEGFNVDPATGGRVFDAALAVSGVGNWLAINRTAESLGLKPTPYIGANAQPLARAELLSRPATDPVYVDVANYTDFYRLRASLTSTTFASPRFRRYDWPSPHAVGGPAAALRCVGRPVPTNPVSYAPFMRALVVALEHEIGVRAAAGDKPLPPAAVFELGDAPAASEGFNPLPGHLVKVPRVDAAGWPLGGVRFPDAEAPVGSPTPVALPPVTTASIDATCGNTGGWRPFDAAEIARRYGSAAARAERYGRQVDALVAEGYLLAADAAAMKAAAR